MALVKCPECGRENVSDTAKMCPSCGFKISEYYHKQKNILGKLRYLQTNNGKRFILIGVVAVVAWALYFFPTRCSHAGCYSKRVSPSFCSYHQSEIDNFSSYYRSYENYNNDKKDASTIFNNLSITNFSSSLGQYGGTMTCEVTNNNTYAVTGYFYVNYYDSRGNLVYSQLMPLADVESGGKATCSTSIPKDDYPGGYDHVEFSQASLTECN